VIQIKRDIKFVGGGKLPVALGIEPARLEHLQKICLEMIDKNCNMQQIMTRMNEEEDLNDAEWSCFMFSMGYYQGINGMGDYSP